MKDQQIQSWCDNRIWNTTPKWHLGSVSLCFWRHRFENETYCIKKTIVRTQLMYSGTLNNFVVANNLSTKIMLTRSGLIDNNIGWEVPHLSKYVDFLLAKYALAIIFFFHPSYRTNCCRWWNQKVRRGHESTVKFTFIITNGELYSEVVYHLCKFKY